MSTTEKSYETLVQKLQSFEKKEVDSKEFSEHCDQLLQIVFEDFLKEGALFAMGQLGGSELSFISPFELLFVSCEGVRESPIFPEKLKKRFELSSISHVYAETQPLPNTMTRQDVIRLRFIGGREAIRDNVMNEREKKLRDQAPFDFKAALKNRVRQQQEHSGDRTFNVQYGNGGLSDIEHFTQMLQVAYGRRLSVEALNQNTSEALKALWKTGFLREKEYKEALACYLFLKRLVKIVRNFREKEEGLFFPEETEVESYTKIARKLGFAGEDSQARNQLKFVTQQYRSVAARLYEGLMTDLAQASWERLPQAPLKGEAY